jgi:hypothetical protein
LHVLEPDIPGVVSISHEYQPFNRGNPNSGMSYFVRLDTSFEPSRKHYLSLKPYAWETTDTVRPDQIPTEANVRYWENGNVRSLLHEGLDYDGRTVFHGKVEHYYESGLPQQTGWYWFGHHDSTWTRWDSLGNVTDSVLYERGIAVKKWVDSLSRE